MRIGVLCSGGDAPGMNACVRGVVRSALAAGHEVIGVLRGYTGLLNESFYINLEQKPLMTLRSVGNIVNLGGTILHSSRCKEFATEEGLKKASGILRKHKIDALLPIGGNGTLRGASELAKYWSGQIVGCPGTIDNDLLGTDYTIGFATAVHTAVECVDKLRDTAQSHDRMFLVEVMGRHSGYIALYTALAAGAEIACIPEVTVDIKEIVENVQKLKARGKQSIILVVAEGDELGGAEILNKDMVEAGCPFPTRVVNLGHLQRGGSPAPADRILGATLGEFAVRSILAGKTHVMAGAIDKKLTLTPLEETFSAHKPVPEELLDLLQTLAS